MDIAALSGISMIISVHMDSLVNESTERPDALGGFKPHNGNFREPSDSE